ncbi:MAG: hypothetical protein WBQ05_16590 [Candidatus Competibacter denitrificans]
MNGIMTQILISAAAKALIGADWEKVKSVVASVADSTLSGSQKREEVIQRLKTLGLSLSESLLNFAIEAAVTWLKQRSR